MPDQSLDKPLIGPDPIFILGRQRSGTTVFRKLLEAEGAYDCDEIFHGDLAEENRFYRFVLNRVNEDSSLVHPEHHGALFVDYIQATHEKAGGRPLAIDIKYFGLNLIPTHEDIGSHQPFVLRYILERDAKVVYIKRINKLRVFVSQKIAENTSNWSAVDKSGLEKNKPRLTIDCDEAIWFIRRLLDQDKRIEYLLQPVRQVQPLIYEDMFSNDVFSEGTIMVAETVLRKRIQNKTPPMIKMNPESINELIDNFDDLAAALQQTELEWMLEIN